MAQQQERGFVLTFQVQGEVVVLPAEQLPDETGEILDLLVTEAQPLSKWFEVARAYLSQNKVGQFVSLCAEATDERTVAEVQAFFGTRPTFELTQFHCAHAAHAIERAREERDKAARADHYTAASKSVALAKREGPEEQLPCLAAGYLALAKVGG